jgi:hypothetical protein
MTDNKSLLDNAHHWRHREEETRRLADAMYNEETKARLRKIADEYARLAERRSSGSRGTAKAPAPIPLMQL